MIASKFRLGLAGSIGLFLFATAATAAVETDRYSILSNGEAVGHLTAVRDGANVDIDYFVDNNGRGPKHKEHLVLAADGAPSQWTIQGTSLMGGPVSEQAVWKDGVERWTSQADHGEAPARAPALYVGNDASPWALGLYAGLLMKAPGEAMDVLPRGRLKLDHIRSLTVGSGARAVNLDAYALSGVDLTPALLLIDGKGRLFAQLDSEILVRAGYERDFAALKALGQELSLQRLQAMQKATAHVFDAPIRIRNVHVFDPRTLATSGPMSVVVFRGRIATVEPSVTDTAAHPDEVIVDGQGGTLTAGLHDMHSHNSLWSGPYYLAAGVTTVRDMGNENPVLLELTRALDAGEAPGPHIIRSGFIEGRSPYSARLGFVPDTLEEALRDVDWYADRGYIQIKIYNSMTPDWVKPLAAEAHRLGLRTVGHVPAFTTPDRMIEDGYDEVTHVNQLMLGWLLKPGEDTRTPLRLTAMQRAADLDLSSPAVRHTIELMKSHGTGLDTTAVILERLMLSRAGQVAEGDRPYLDHMPVGYQRYRMRSFVSFKDEAEKARYDAAFGKVLDTMALLHRQGIPLWPGTDDATGFTVHRELELYNRIGMSPGEVLKVATYDCDRYMGRDQDYGSIARGKKADVFLTVGDPSRDISAVRQIRMVMKDGVVYFPSEIYAQLGVKPFAPPPPVTLPKAPPPAVSAAATAASGFAADDEDLQP